MGFLIYLFSTFPLDPSLVASSVADPDHMFLGRLDPDPDPSIIKQ
jgi:hypothetical protein